MQHQHLAPITRIARSALAFAIVFTLAFTMVGVAHAQGATPAPAPNAQAQAKALAQARAELARAAARVAELSGNDSDAGTRTMRIQKRIEWRPVVGVLLVPDDKAGARIAGVTPDSGAAKAGLKAGDRLLSINGKPILGASGDLRLANTRKLLGGLDDKSPALLGYVRDGRDAVVAVTPQIDQRVFVWNGGGGSLVKAVGPVTLLDGDHGTFEMHADDLEVDAMPTPNAMVAPEIRREIVRIGPDGACKGDACRAPMLMSAFRWNGLNLASIDAQLGRYFGTDHGVLVLSSGELAGLQTGDVIQRIDGKSVTSPRDAMAALRAKPEGTRAAVEYMRDRKSGAAQVAVPKLVAFPDLPGIAPPAPTPTPAARSPAARAPTQGGVAD